MRRRPRGSGSVKMRGDGSALIRWKETGRRRGKVLRGVTEQEANEALDAMMVTLQERGEWDSVADFVEDWLDWPAQKRRSDRPALGSRFKLYVRAYPIGRLAVRSLRPSHVKSWLLKLERDGVGQAQRRHCANLLGAALRDAVELEVVATNPVRAVRRPPVPTSRVKFVLTKEQIQAVVDTDRLVPDVDEELERAGRLVVMSLIGTLVRPGELLGLRTEDYHPSHLSVWRSGRDTDSTKTDEARRVDLIGWGAWALERWLEIRPTLKIRRLRVDRSPWLFPIPPAWLRGRHIVGRILGAVSDLELHAHDMRGTGATHYLSGTWGEPLTIADVAAMLGDSIATTQKAYAHILPTRIAEMGKRIRVSQNPPIGQRSMFRCSSVGLRSQRSRVRIAPGAQPIDGLVGPISSEREFGSGSHPDPIVAATQVLEALASGDRSQGDLAIGSLLAALASEPELSGAIAAVLAGGPHADHRALDLVALVRAREVAMDDSADGGAR